MFSVYRTKWCARWVSMCVLTEPVLNQFNVQNFTSLLQFIVCALPFEYRTLSLTTALLFYCTNMLLCIYNWQGGISCILCQPIFGNAFKSKKLVTSFRVYDYELWLIQAIPSNTSKTNECFIIIIEWTLLLFLKSHWVCALLHKIIR